MKFNIVEEGKFRYVEVGEGEVVLLLHGLFGALSNFRGVIKHFFKNYKVTIPILPLYELPTEESTVTGMVNYVDEFIKFRKYKTVNLIGNSLGGHIALLYALKRKEKVSSLVLTGSSGLFESAMGDGYPKKGDYEYVKKKTEYTFYDPKTATKELIDEVYGIINDRNRAIRILYLAKSAIRHNLREELEKIIAPVKLIWGKQDRITPVFVGEEFKKLLPHAELDVLDKCGHAAMMERPEEFNSLVESFLQRNLVTS